MQNLYNFDDEEDDDDDDDDDDQEELKLSQIGGGLNFLDDEQDTQQKMLVGVKEEDMNKFSQELTSNNKAPPSSQFNMFRLAQMTKLCQVNDTAKNAFDSLNQLFDEQTTSHSYENTQHQQTHVSQPQKISKIQHISEIPAQKLAEVVAKRDQREKNQKQQSNDGSIKNFINLPSINSVAQNLPSFIKPPPNVLQPGQVRQFSDDISSSPLQLSSHNFHDQNQLQQSNIQAISNGLADSQSFQSSNTNIQGQSQQFSEYYIIKMLFSMLTENPFLAQIAQGDQNKQIWTCFQNQQIFGKFSSKQMYDWSKAGCFTHKLMIRNDEMAYFQPMLVVIQPVFMKTVPTQFMNFIMGEMGPPQQQQQYSQQQVYQNRNLRGGRGSFVGGNINNYNYRYHGSARGSYRGGRSRGGGGNFQYYRPKGAPPQMPKALPSLQNDKNKAQDQNDCYVYRPRGIRGGYYPRGYGRGFRGSNAGSYSRGGKSQ